MLIFSFDENEAIAARARSKSMTTCATWSA
jgi:hypothetical protein